MCCERSESSLLKLEECLNLLANTQKGVINVVDATAFKSDVPSVAAFRTATAATSDRANGWLPPAAVGGTFGAGVRGRAMESLP
jgi:hypothetical protein